MEQKFYINEFKTYENGLNSTIGGEGCLGYTHSPEIRQKISENVKNGNSHKGKTYEKNINSNNTNINNYGSICTKTKANEYI